MKIVWLLGFIILQMSCQPTPSDNCQLYNDNNSVCTACMDGYYLLYWFCAPCAPLCQCTKNSPNYCESCVNIDRGSLAGKVLAIMAPMKNKCLLCDQLMPNCLECSQLTVCTKCYGGFYPVTTNSSSTVCSSTQCTPNCELCSSSNTCSLCAPGYYLSNNQCAAQCLNNCTICNGTTSCKVCQPGTYLQTTNQGQSCNPCLSGCLLCTNATGCDVCAPGSNFVATPTPQCSSNGNSNCVLYASNFSICLSCQPNYSIFQGSCNQCSGCKLCSAAFICQSSCQTGFNPSNYACLHQGTLIISIWVLLTVIGLYF